MPAVRTEEQTQGGPAVKIPGSKVRVPVPSTQDLLYYGGLGAMTAFELIEWPVTLAVGAGYALASHDRERESGQ